MGEWSDAPPTQPGVYGVTHPTEGVLVVQVWRRASDELELYHFGSEEAVPLPPHTIGPWTTARWYGPIALPPVPDAQQTDTPN